MRTKTTKLNLICFLNAFVIIFWSCSGGSKKERIDDNVNTSNTDQKNQLLITSQNGTPSNIPINADLPFGPSLLETYKFPTEWSRLESDPKGQINNKKLSEIQELFNGINLAKSINSPKIKELEFINLSDFKDSLLFSIDSIKYRLPNLGPYECFYSFMDVSRPHEEDKDYEERSDQLIETGNLILYDPKTQKAKVINIYNSIAGIFWGSGRYFYLGKNEEIKLFYHKSDEDVSKLLQRFTIKVQNNGKIKIKKNHNS